MEGREGTVSGYPNDLLLRLLAETLNREKLRRRVADIVKPSPAPQKIVGLVDQEGKGNLLWAEKNQDR